MGFVTLTEMNGEDLTADWGDTWTCEDCAEDVEMLAGDKGMW